MPTAFPTRSDRPVVITASLALIVAAGLASAPPAFAQDHGERMATIAAEHAQQMNDYGYTASQNYADDEDEDEYYSDEEDTGYYGSFAPTAPMTLEIQYLLQATRRDQEIITQIRTDPRFERYANGGWDYYQSRLPAGPGEYCAATYLNRDGMITLTGVDSSWDGGMLIFVGREIPKPATFREISATLTQTGDAPATVRVYNFELQPETPEFGTLVFAVPTMEAALAGMTDELEFVIRIEDQEVFRMTWQDGQKARDELRKCLRQRRR